MKKSKKKEMIAPIVITILMFLYYALYFLVLYSLCSELPNPILWKIFFAIIPLISGFFLIKVCVERIKEIREGEEDDIGEY